VLDVNKKSEALDILRRLAVQTRRKAGCIRCDIYKSLEDNNSILIEQLWRSRKDLYAHLRSNDCKNLLFVFEMAQSEPIMEFHSIISSEGLELVKKARNSSWAKNQDQLKI
jgi:quinol monooxygenase YgiN